MVRKYYVAEGGCKYNGGSVFAVSLNLENVMYSIRAKKLESEENGDPFNQVSEYRWESSKEYIDLRTFAEA